VEELLRLEGPVKVAGRTALVDQHVGGQHIRPGQAALVHVQQANRDPLQYRSPLRLDLTRKPSGYLAFGAGPHFCLGAALARLETAETLTRLFTQYPQLARADRTTQWRRSTTFYALDKLHVRL
jgi:cytochrome P450